MRNLARSSFREFLALGVLVLLATLATLGPSISDEDNPPRDPQLEIRYDGGTLTYKTSELLNRPDLEEFTIVDVAAYPRQEVTFQAVKLATLLESIEIPDEATVEFTALDGFALTIMPEILLNTGSDKAVAYLAVEDPENKWPLRPNDEFTAGPYYLFWLKPELSNIGREEWPFQIDGIEIRSSLETLYPRIFPAEDIESDHPIRKGMASFIKNCLTCHTMNLQGPADMGPDLNYPMSPREYFKKGILRQFIRDPQSVRHNPFTPMAPFGPDLIPDEELDHLIAYLKHMAKHRPTDIVESQ